MTMDDVIKHVEEIADTNQRVVDTGIVFDDVTIDMLYCDDTEIIEEHLANYQWCADEHRQLAEWLKDYKRLLEQQPSEDCVSRAEVRKIAKEMYLEIANMDLDVHTISDCISYTSSKCRQVLEDKLQSLSPVTPTHGTCKDCEYRGAIYANGECYCDNDGTLRERNFYCKDYEKRGNENGA